MKHCLKPFFALIMITLLTTSSVQAETEEKMVIALKTDSFDLVETDISTLAVGEAKTIETESGKVIDILRTIDGAEVYIDGELLEMNFNDEGLHEEHMIRKHVEVDCGHEEECDKHIVIHTDGDSEISEWLTEGGENIIIHEEIEISCSDEEGSSCDENLVWISEDEEINLEELHREHADGESHRVIVIKKEIDTRN